MRSFIILAFLFVHINCWGSDLEDLSITEIPVGSKIQFQKPTVIPSGTSSIYFSGCTLSFAPSSSVRQFTPAHSLVVQKVDGNIQYERVGVDCQLLADGSSRCSDYENRNVAYATLTFKVQKNNVDTGAAPVELTCQDESGSAFMSIRGLNQDLALEGAKLIINGIADF